jgi:hypothetical protein
MDADTGTGAVSLGGLTIWIVVLTVFIVGALGMIGYVWWDLSRRPQINTITQSATGDATVIAGNLGVGNDLVLQGSLTGGGAKSFAWGAVVNTNAGTAIGTGTTSNSQLSASEGEGYALGNVLLLRLKLTAGSNVPAGTNILLLQSAFIPLSALSYEHIVISNAGMVSAREALTANQVIHAMCVYVRGT